VLQSPLPPPQQLNEANDSYDSTIVAKHHQMKKNANEINAQDETISNSSRGTEERKKNAQDAIDENDKQQRCERDTAVGVPKRNAFEVRLAELAAFKANHGHCNASQTKSREYQSLGKWCSHVRVSYKQIQEGKTLRHPLSQDQIGRLEALGFEWSKHRSFEERLAELVAFKTKHGHCNPPCTPSSQYYRLGQWCNKKRASYKQILEGKTPQQILSQDQIVRLEMMGFQWKRKKTFEGWLVELAEFKAEYGHCNAPHTIPSRKYYLLGTWCTKMRASYKKIQKGKTPYCPLSQDQIERLETLGFEWRRRRR